MIPPIKNINYSFGKSLFLYKDHVPAIKIPIKRNSKKRNPNASE